jgi:hypothetical protein
VHVTTEVVVVVIVVVISEVGVNIEIKIIRKDQNLEVAVDHGVANEENILDHQDTIVLKVNVIEVQRHRLLLQNQVHQCRKEQLHQRQLQQKQKQKYFLIIRKTMKLQSTIAKL